MKTKIIIPHPCNQSWEHMLQQEEGRFCMSCQKTVIDFTAYDDAAFITYFQSLKETPCVRLTKRQLSLDIPAQQVLFLHPVKLYRYLTAGLLSMMSLPAVAQVKQAEAMAINKEGSRESVAGQVPAHTEPDTIEIKGRVTDQYREGIPGASIKLKNTEHVTYSDIDGYFALKINNTERASGILHIQAIGYQTPDVNLSNQPGNITITLIDDNNVIAGGAFIIRKPSFWQRITRPFRRRH